MDNTGAVVEQFRAVTGASPSESKFYLESHNWNLEEALATYFSSNSNTTAASSSSNSVNLPSEIPNNSNSTTSNTNNKSKTTKGGVRGFSDYKGEGESTNDDKTTTWFTGGEKSGLQVQAPINKSALVDNLMKNAKNLGAKDYNEYEEENKSFSGSGFRLGQTNSQPSHAARSNVKKVIRKKITLWKNGFTIDDSTLRDYYDPLNQAFMNKIQNGQMPNEFAKEAAEGDIDLELIDSRNEDYKEPPKVMQAFTGTGHTLGSSTSSNIPQTQNKPVDSSPKVNIDQTQPTTSIQIRLADGQRLLGTFNHFHTIKDIKSYINSAVNTSYNYDLMTSFPQKVLENESQSIKDAGLINSVVIQKRK